MLLAYVQDATPKMKTLLNSRDRIEILERLEKVRMDAQARWGTMSSHQMICHLSDSLRAALGEKYISPVHQRPETRNLETAGALGSNFMATRGQDAP
jgi:hypothetical protein